MTIKHFLLKNYSKSSLQGNLYNIKRFTDYYQDRAQKATYADVLQYIQHLRTNTQLHPKTLKHCLYAVKIYFNYLLETGVRKDHPCSELLLKDKTSKLVRVENLYSQKTLDRFWQYDQLLANKHLQKRNKIIISLLIYQALTVNEIALIQVQHIDLQKGTILIHSEENQHNKSPTNRTLPLKANQILLMQQYLKHDRKKLLVHNHQNPEEKAFILARYGKPINPHSISRIINLNRPKADQLKPIKIRQSVLTNFLKMGHDPRVVQVFAGHKKVTTTIQYKQSNLQRLTAAIRQYHPLKTTQNTNFTTY